MTELADIFRTYGPAYRAKFGGKMPPQHLRVMRAIERCRTPALGGHAYTCPDCHETVYHYHSCRNRHCPKHALSGAEGCQHENAQRWLEQHCPCPTLCSRSLAQPTPPLRAQSSETRVRCALSRFGGGRATIGA